MNESTFDQSVAHETVVAKNFKSVRPPKDPSQPQTPMGVLKKLYQDQEEWMGLYTKADRLLASIYVRIAEVYDEYFNVGDVENHGSVDWNSLTGLFNSVGDGTNESKSSKKEKHKEVKETAVIGVLVKHVFIAEDERKDNEIYQKKHSNRTTIIKKIMDNASYYDAWKLAQSDEKTSLVDWIMSIGGCEAFRTHTFDANVSSTDDADEDLTLLEKVQNHFEGNQQYASIAKNEWHSENSKLLEDSKVMESIVLGIGVINESGTIEVQDLLFANYGDLGLDHSKLVNQVWKSYEATALARQQKQKPKGRVKQ